MNIRNKKKILKRMIRSFPLKMDASNYAFYCSKDFKSKVRIYKGYPVYYMNTIKSKTIYFTHNSFM